MTTSFLPYLSLVLFLGRIDPECVRVSVCVRVCVRAISRKPWPVRVRVTQGLSLSNSPGVIETNGLSFSILLGGHLDPQIVMCHPL